jgi:hypothetical protein
VRLHTRKLKENPGLVQNRKKTPGEKLVEKFLIKDKPTEQAKRRQNGAEAISAKHVRRDPGGQEAEDRHSGTPRRENIQDLERSIDRSEPDTILSKKRLAHEEEEGEEDVVTVTQSEALDILLSETENEAEIISEKPKVMPEQSPSEKYASLKGKQNTSSTVKKRPKKRDKGSTIKRVEHNPAETIQAAAEKSLLQRRNTVKKLRRNSRDIELLTLAIDENESSVMSTPAGSLPTPASSITSTPPTSTTPTPVNSTPSTPIASSPVTPMVETLPLEVGKPVVFESQCSNRDMFPFKTKVSDRKCEPNISKIVSVDVSVENSCDVFKKMPLKFVVDEIKVEETPKSPKLLRYEVTVEEVANNEIPFQGGRDARDPEVLDKSRCNLDRDETFATMRHGLTPAEECVVCKSSSISNLKEESEFKFNLTDEEQKAEIIPETSPDSETVPEAEVSVCNVVESNSKQAHSPFSPGDRCSEEGEKEQALTAGSEIHAYSKEDTESDYRAAKDELANEEIKCIAPKCDAKASLTEKEFGQVEILKNAASANKVTMHKDGTGTPQAQHKDKIEKDTSNKKFLAYLKLAEKNSSCGRPEIPVTSDQKNEQSCIPAWKKALIARTQANNASKAQGQIDMQHKCQLIPVSQVSNKDCTTASRTSASDTSTLEAIVEPRTESCEHLLQDENPQVLLSAESCSTLSKPEESEEDQIGKTKSADAESLCANSGADKVAQHSGKSSPGGKPETRGTGNEQSDVAFPAEQDVKPSGTVDVQNLNSSAADLRSSKGKKNADRKVAEGKVKPSEPPSARKDKPTEIKLENVGLRNTERTPFGLTRAAEGKAKDVKAKPAVAAVANRTKDGEMEMARSKLKLPQMSPEQKSPANTNVTKCETNSSTLVISESVETKPLGTKLKDVDTPPVSDPKSAIEPSDVKTVTAEIKPDDEKKTAAGEFPLEKLECAEASASVEDAKQDRKEGSGKPKLAETSAADNAESKEEKPESKQTKTKAPEKKRTPVNAKVPSHGKSSGTLPAETGNPVAEEADLASCTAAVGLKAGEPAVTAAEEEEASSEDEEDTDSGSDDDGEEVTRLSQRASTSSSEDSGFDSLPTSVPGSPAYYKKDPNTKGTRPSF